MKKATAIAAKHIDGRISLVAGTGARTTTACISLSKHAEDVGCDGVVVLPVSYWPLTTDEVFDHYERVAKSVNIPICVYNNPWTTGVDMKPMFLARIVQLPNCNCIKESTGDLTRITAIRLLTKDQVTLIAGWESTSLQAFMAGATGWAPVCSNFVPRDAMKFFDVAVDKRDASVAQSIWDKLFPICDIICAKSHIRVAHTGLRLAEGSRETNKRQPPVPLPPRLLAHLRRWFAKGLVGKYFRRSKISASSRARDLNRSTTSIPAA